MAWTESATFDDIVAEMQRSPDAGLLLEWIYEHTKGGSDDPVVGEVADAIQAYWNAEEDL